MKILIILPFVPLGRNSGGNQAVINMLDYLRGRCDLTLTFPMRHHDQAGVDRIAREWPEVSLRPYKYWKYDYKYVPFKTDRDYLSGRKKMDKGRGRMLFSFFKHNVVSVNPSDVIRDNTLLMVGDIIQDCPSPFFSFVMELVKSTEFDIVQTEFMNFVNLSYYLPAEVRKVMVHHEIHFVRIENEVALFPDRRIGDDALFQYAKDMELAALRRFDDIIVLTEQDKKILEPLLPGTNIHCSPAAIPEIRPLDFKPCGKEFAFVGGMSHHPNLDGILWFVSEVVPELRKRMSDFKVHIVGDWEKKFVKAISKACPEVVFDGFVDNLGSFLNGRISIVPIRIGSGMRMKILDAVNSRSPFITTGKGVEGQDFNDGVECMVCDTPDSFADAMVRLSSDTALQEKMTSKAYETLKREYDSAAILARRYEVYQQICKLKK